MRERLKNSHSCSVIILAAGKSSRMGSPKLGLQFDKKETFLEAIIRQYRSYSCKEILVVINEDGAALIRSKSIDISSDVVLVTNTHLEWERFYSVKLGMQHLKCTYPVFIHNVDNPFANKEILSSLHNNISKVDYVVPVFQGRGGHPILVSEKIILAIKDEPKNDLILSDFLTLFDKKMLEVDDQQILVNINSKETYNNTLKKDSII